MLYPIPLSKQEFATNSVQGFLYDLRCLKFSVMQKQSKGTPGFDCDWRASHRHSRTLERRVRTTRHDDGDTCVLIVIACRSTLDELFTNNETRCCKKYWKISSFFVSYPPSSLNGTQPKLAKCSEISAVLKCISETWSIPSPTNGRFRNLKANLMAYIFGMKHNMDDWASTLATIRGPLHHLKTT